LVVARRRAGKAGILNRLPARIAYGPDQNKQPEFLAMPTAAKKTSAVGAGPAAAVFHLAQVTDRMHALLMDRADALMGCTENSPEEAELAALTDVIGGLRTPEMAAGSNSWWQGLVASTQAAPCL